MALLNGRRHLVRYVAAALVLFFFTYQFLLKSRGPSRTSTHRHLKDPVQELKDSGAYVPVHADPISQSKWPAGKDESIAKQIALEDAVDIGEHADIPKTGGKATDTTSVEPEVDKGVLSKISSLESERSLTMSPSSLTYATPTASPPTSDGYEDSVAVTTPPYPMKHASTPLSDDYLSAATSLPTPTTHTTPRPTLKHQTPVSRPTFTGTPSHLASAHVLPSADAFLSHFAALPDQPNLTVSDAMETCTWPDTLLVNFQFGTDAEWAVNLRNASDISHHRGEWQHFVLHDTVPYSSVAEQFEGRGIVIVAGNERSLKRTFVLLRLLKRFKTSLPVEIHHHGVEELSSSNKTTLKSIYTNLSFSDLASPDQPVSTTANGYINYNLKTAALLNSRFAEPLLLDSDNLPVSDPSVLFSSKTYKEYGTVFWPDIARTRPENPIWALTNTPCSMSEYEQESGQLLVNKQKFWYHLQLAKFFADAEYYHEFLLGDKDTFRFAWRALQTEYGRPQRWLTSVGVVQRPRDERAWPSEPDVKSGVGSTSAMSKEREEGEDREEDQGMGLYCGHSFGQHAPDSIDSPILFLHGGLVKTLTPPQIEHARKFGRGLFAAYKDSPSTTNRSAVESVRIKWDGGAYLEEDERNKMKYSAHCTDMENVSPALLGDAKTSEFEGFEAIAEEAGFYWMVVASEQMQSTEPSKGSKESDEVGVPEVDGDEQGDEDAAEAARLKEVATEASGTTEKDEWKNGQKPEGLRGEDENAARRLASTAKKFEGDGGKSEERPEGLQGEDENEARRLASTAKKFDSEAGTGKGYDELIDEGDEDET